MIRQMGWQTIWMFMAHLEFGGAGELALGSCDQAWRLGSRPKIEDSARSCWLFPDQDFLAPFFSGETDHPAGLVVWSWSTMQEPWKIPCKWVWVNTYTFLVGWTSINPSYFDVHQGYQGFDPSPNLCHFHHASSIQRLGRRSIVMRPTRQIDGPWLCPVENPLIPAVLWHLVPGVHWQKKCRWHEMSLSCDVLCHFGIGDDWSTDWSTCIIWSILL